MSEQDGNERDRTADAVSLLDDMGCRAGVGSPKLTTVMKTTTETNTKSYATIKLGIDAHAKWYYVARQLDGATPQPVQKMEIDGLLHFVAKQQGLAREVHTCYEAGAFGYHLHRKLGAMGVSNLVVQPQDWDERGKGVKKAIVAVNLWRLFTGQTRADKLGLIYLPDAA